MLRNSDETLPMASIIRLALAVEQVTSEALPVSSELVRLLVRSDRIDDAEALARSQPGHIYLLQDIATELLSIDPDRAYRLMTSVKGSVGLGRLELFLQHDFERTVQAILPDRNKDSSSMQGFLLAEAIEHLVKHGEREKALTLLSSRRPDEAGDACGHLVLWNASEAHVQLAIDFAKTTDINDFEEQFPFFWLLVIGGYIRDRSLFRWLRSCSPNGKGDLLLRIALSEPESFLGRSALRRLATELSRGNVAVQHPQSVTRHLASRGEIVFAEFVKMIQDNVTFHRYTDMRRLALYQPEVVVRSLAQDRQPGEYDADLLELIDFVAEFDGESAAYLANQVCGASAKRRALIAITRRSPTPPSAPSDSPTEPTLPPLDTATENTDFDSVAATASPSGSAHGFRPPPSELSQALEHAWRIHEDRPRRHSLAAQLAVALGTALHENGQAGAAVKLIRALIPEPLKWRPSPAWEHSGDEECRVRAICLAIAAGEDHLDRLKQIWQQVEADRPTYTWHAILRRATSGLVMLDPTEAINCLSAIDQPITAATFCLEGLSQASALAPQRVTGPSRRSLIEFAKDVKPMQTADRNDLARLTSLAEAWIPFDKERAVEIAESAIQLAETYRLTLSAPMDFLWVPRLVGTIAQADVERALRHTREHVPTELLADALLAVFDVVRISDPAVAHEVLNQINGIAPDDRTEARRRSANILRTPAHTLSEAEAARVVDDATEIDSPHLLLILSKELVLQKEGQRAWLHAILAGAFSAGPEAVETTLKQGLRFGEADCSEGLTQFLSKAQPLLASDRVPGPNE
jgi:hypothetical protein